MKFFDDKPADELLDPLNDSCGQRVMPVMSPRCSTLIKISLPWNPLAVNFQIIVSLSHASLILIITVQPRYCGSPEGSLTIFVFLFFAFHFSIFYFLVLSVLVFVFYFSIL